MRVGVENRDLQDGCIAHDFSESFSKDLVTPVITQADRFKECNRSGPSEALMQVRRWNTLGRHVHEAVFKLWKVSH